MTAPQPPSQSISANAPVLYTMGQRSVHGVFISRTEIEHLIDCSWQFSLFAGLASAAIFFGGGVLISYLSVTDRTPFFIGVAASLGVMSVVLFILFAALARHEFGRRAKDIGTLFSADDTSGPQGSPEATGEGA